jgi:hypothetical protein
MIAKPFRQIRFAPLPVFFHRVERAVLCVVKHRLVGLYERIFHALFERAFRRCLEFGIPLSQFFVRWFADFH